MAHRELFAYIAVNNAAEAMAFYASVFGATEKFRLTEPSGRIGHAEMDFGGPTLMISDEFPEYGVAGPRPGAPAASNLSQSAVTTSSPKARIDALSSR